MQMKEASPLIKEADYGYKSREAMPKEAVIPASVPEKTGELLSFTSSEQAYTLVEPLLRGAIFTGASLNMKGRKFTGKDSLKLSDILKLWGTEITPASGKQKTFTIDFHGLRNISGVDLGGLDINIISLKQWLGVQFSPDPVVVSPGSYASFPVILTQKLLVACSAEVTAQEFINNCSFIFTSYPSNLKMSLGSTPAFWFYAGELITEVDTPDFSSQLNDFIKSSPSLPAKLELNLHSDTPGDIEMTPKIELKFRVPAKLKDDIKRIDFAGNEQREVNVELVENNNISQVVSLGLDFQGEFGANRAGEGFETVKEVIGARVSSLYTLAQRITLKGSCNAQKLSIYMNKLTSEAEVYLEIRGGSDDNPEDSPLVSSSEANLKALKKPSWVDFAFDSPVAFSAESYWVILKAKVGEAIWYADSCGDSDTLSYSRDGGVSWNGYVAGAAGIRGFFKLFFMPEPPVVVPAVSITVLKGKNSVLKGAEKQITPTEELQSLSLDIIEGIPWAGGLTLYLKSETSGWLGLSNLYIEYTS